MSERMRVCVGAYSVCLIMSSVNHSIRPFLNSLVTRAGQNLPAQQNGIMLIWAVHAHTRVCWQHVPVVGILNSVRRAGTSAKERRSSCIHVA